MLYLMKLLILYETISKDLQNLEQKKLLIDKMNKKKEEEKKNKKN